MSLYNDYINFLDSGTKVPYFVHNVSYYVKHSIQEDYFEHEFKLYYKNCNRYFVGIHSEDLVRKISAKEYKEVLQDKKEARERTRLFSENTLF
ncbi:MAG: hypothetical protein RQ763_07935 [Sulfurimonas sp.]|uniref:hypothetical protein n=1 Tax=Sulfurimonas sp. TaxID=2022749 RepID=UPI0028CBC53A|nr:hypothetical protein [Sulfurimonas sp.]MDT8339114.1 hypothetical protein [Sulfurimonas sp.]